jgi:hypothetical protein
MAAAKTNTVSGLPSAAKLEATDTNAPRTQAIQTGRQAPGAVADPQHASRPGTGSCWFQGQPASQPLATSVPTISLHRVVRSVRLQEAEISNCSSQIRFDGPSSPKDKPGELTMTFKAGSRQRQLLFSHSIEGDRLCRHLQTGFRAPPASRHAILHPTNAFAAFGAFGADLRAFVADVPMVLTADEHEVRRCPANFGAGSHLPKVL